MRKVSSILNHFNVYEKSILFIVVCIYINNLFLDIMNVDAAQYASISLEMLRNQSYLQVFDFQSDYLDKPPLLFWISSLSLGLIGLCNFAYKLGAFLMLLLSLYAIFKFSLLYYSQEIAKNAVLIFGSCQAFFLMTNDVRTDGLLSSSVIVSVWLLAEFLLRNKLKHLLLGAVFTAFGMMAKGPIGIIAVLMPIGLHLIYQRKWNKIFNASWLLYIVVVGLLLVPMSYGLYAQFDLHPEKIINGKLNQSGLYFYYWLQSFGRITGENVWDNGLPWHFFIGSISWDFFPWILLLYAGLFLQFRKLIFSKNEKPIEIISLSGFVLLFALLSMSRYKLPHYIFVSLPFASIISALYVSKINQKQRIIWEKIYFGFGCIILLLLTIYPLFFFKELNYELIALLLLQAFLLIRMNKLPLKGLTKMMAYVLVFNLFLSFVFYPKLLTFQADAMAGKWFYKNKAKETVYLLDRKSHLFNFYTQNPYQQSLSLKDVDTIKKTCWLYTNQEHLLEIEKKFQIIEKKKFSDYPITQLKLAFLLEKKRLGTLDYYYLIQIEPKP